MSGEIRGYGALAAVIIIIAWVLGLAIRDARRTRLEQAERNEEWLREHVFHPGMSVPDLDMPHGMWPTCGTPPCDWEDDFRCCAHQPVSERVGKHRAVWQGSLDDESAEVILAVVTDCEKRRQS